MSCCLSFGITPCVVLSLVLVSDDSVFKLPFSDSVGRTPANASDVKSRTACDLRTQLGPVVCFYARFATRSAVYIRTYVHTAKNVFPYALGPVVRDLTCASRASDNCSRVCWN